MGARPDQLPRLLKAPHAAQYLGVSVSTFYKLGFRAKRIPGHTLALYDRHDLDDFAAGLPYEGQSEREVDACDAIFGTGP